MQGQSCAARRQLDHLKQQPSESSAKQEHGLHRTFDELRLGDMPTLVHTLTLEYIELFVIMSGDRGGELSEGGR